MGCGCGGRGNARRAGRALVTSGGLTPTGMVGTQHRSVQGPTQEPLGVVAHHGEPEAVEPVDGAAYRVITDSVVAFFPDHGGAFQWQRDSGGRLRTVR